MACVASPRLASVNTFLEEKFLGPFNTKFMVTAARTAGVYRPLESEQDLARILADCEERVVQHDWTIRWHNACLQLASGNDVEPGQSVMIYEQLDG